jgi:transposase
MNEDRQETVVLRAVGLDAHPYLFTLTELAGPNAREAKALWVVDRRPLDQLEKVLKERTKPGDTIVLEATGNSFTVAGRILRCGRTPVVLNSEAVSDIGRKYCVTDKEDAIKLARAWMTGYAKVVWQPDPRTADYRHIFFSYQNAVRDDVRARNRVWAFLDEHCIKKPTKLRLHDPAAMRSLLALRSWSDVESEVLGDLVSACRAASIHRQELDARIARLVTADKQIIRLTRLLGVRHIVAFAVYAIIGDIHRFPSAKSLVSYFGLSPSICESGNNRHLGSTAISHSGRVDVRALLVQGAQSVLRYGKGPIKEWAVRLKMRRGTNVAIVAVARKIAVQIWYLLMGFAPSLTEVPASLRLKIRKIARAIGPTRIREMGYETPKAFEEDKIALLTQTT